MDRLFLDLSKDARRQTIYAALLKQLDSESGSGRNSAGASLSPRPADLRAEVEARLEASAVPDVHHHGLAEVLETIDGLAVSDRVKADMRGIYRILAEAEAQVHGCTVEETHFHEVGNGSSIRNALGICLAIEALDPRVIEATAVQTGKGQVQCAHGLLDIPAPATAAILARGIPVCEERLEGELCTPTSAAVIKHFVNGFDS